MIHSSRGKVPHFSLRPHPGVMLLTGMVLLFGTLTALSFYTQMDGTGTYVAKGHFVMIVTIILTILLLIVATSKMWFAHLWKKNSTHKRHAEHSEYHPINRDKRQHGDEPAIPASRYANASSQRRKSSGKHRHTSRHRHK